MPIIIRDYTWRQSEKTITIHVPLHGIHNSKVDILTTESYIKASFEQCFFEVFLFYNIDEEASKCTLDQKEIIFELAKTEEIFWETLEKDLTKKQKMDVKHKAIEITQKKITDKEDNFQVKKSNLKRCAVSEAVSLDTQQRNKIQEIKNEEKINALSELQLIPKKPITVPAIKMRKPKVHYDKNTIASQTSVPLPRAPQIIDVSFTERVLPTPCRESKEDKENTWLKMQAEARRSAGFVSEDLRPEEKNPQYLKAKGDEFLKSSNYLGAISAYGFGIKISPKFVDFYIGRSEAHMAIGNFNKAVTDCSTALELMKPEVWGNLYERAICIGRRGIGLHKLGLKQQAIDELRASIQLRPENVQFQKYLYEVLHEKTDEDE